MSKEVAKKEDTALAVQMDGDGMFGFEQATSKDIKIPIIYVAQAMSKVVGDGVCSPGAIVENLNNTKLGDMKKPAQVIPFYFQKSYVVQKVKNGKKEFAANEPYDKEREYEETIDGITQYNLPCFNFFVFVVGDESYTKYVLSFRGSRNITSGGKPMLTQLMNKFQTVKAAPFNFVFDIATKQVENEKGKWYVLTSQQAVKEGKEVFSSDAARTQAHKAYRDIEAMFKQGVQFDVASVDEETSVPAEESFDKF
jgi:hypothetical protein